jgi:ABC-type bacteriocin/lantibiotic exporter with double-glycine peptidase domain
MIQKFHATDLFPWISNRLKSLFRRHVPYVQQMEEIECGPACLTMILRYYGCHTSLAEVRERCGTSRDGVSALALKLAAETYGLNCVGLRTDSSGLVDMPHPVIIHWASHHFVVLEAIDHKGAWIVDPAEGRCYLSLESLEEKFTGTALRIIPSKTFVLRPPQRGYWRFYL